MKKLIRGKHESLFTECERLKGLLNAHHVGADDDQSDENIQQQFEQNVYLLLSRLVKEDNVLLLDSILQNLLDADSIRGLISHQANSLFYAAFSLERPAYRAATWLFNNDLYTPNHPHPVFEAAQYAAEPFMSQVLYGEDDNQARAADDDDISGKRKAVDPKTVTHGQLTLLHALCAASKHPDPSRVLKPEQLDSYFLLCMAEDCDVNAMSLLGTPLKCALEAKKPAMVASLLRFGASEETLTTQTGNAYHYIRDVESFMHIKDNAVLDINQVDANGLTPLQNLLCATNMSKAVKQKLVALFCEFGADPDLQNRHHKNAYDYLNNCAEPRILRATMDKHPAHLVLMRQIEVLPAAMKRSSMLTPLLQTQTRATRRQFNATFPMAYFPMDNQPMPVINANQIDLNLLIYSILSGLHILLKALMLLQTRPNGLVANQTLAVAHLVKHDALLVYTALRAKHARLESGEGMYRWLTRLFYPNGMQFEDYVKLTVMAVRNKHHDLIEALLSQLEQMKDKLWLIQNVDLVAMALRLGHLEVVEQIHQRGYPYTQKHIAIAAKSSKVGALTLKQMIQQYAGGADKPLAGTQILNDAPGLNQQKIAVLVEAGVTVKEDPNAVKVNVAPVNYGSISQPTTPAKSQKSTKKKYNDAEGIPLVARKEW